MTVRRAHSQPPALDDAIRQFHAEIERLAWAAVRAVIGEELARRRTRPGRGRSRAGRPARSPARQLELGFTQLPQRQLELPLARPAADSASSGR